MLPREKWIFYYFHGKQPRVERWGPLWCRWCRTWDMDCQETLRLLRLTADNFTDVFLGDDSVLWPHPWGFVLPCWCLFLIRKWAFSDKLILGLSYPNFRKRRLFFGSFCFRLFAFREQWTSVFWGTSICKNTFAAAFKRIRCLEVVNPDGSVYHSVHGTTLQKRWSLLSKFFLDPFEASRFRQKLEKTFLWTVFWKPGRAEPGRCEAVAILEAQNLFSFLAWIEVR